MISGTEDHHAKLRAEVCRYMVTDGKPIINHYLKTFSEDCYGKSAMTENGIWATDVEIMAIPCTLTYQKYLNNDKLYSYIQASSSIVTFVDASTWDLYKTTCGV